MGEGHEGVTQIYILGSTLEVDQALIFLLAEKALVLELLDLGLSLVELEVK